jgi:hypothetical protein
MEKKFWFETNKQITASGVVFLLVVGGSIPSDDRRHEVQGAPIEQPHDHHERTPFQETTLNPMAASGSSTASVTTFNSVFFDAWSYGEATWPVITRPDLYL